MDFAQAPDGNLQYVSISTGTIRSIQYVGTANRPPVARAAADRLAGLVPLTVSFSSAGSSDPDGDPLTYSWSFGDGSTSTEANPSHTYTQAGTFTVTLDVSDGRGGVTRATSTPGTTSRNLNLTFNGQTFRTPVTFESVVGFEHIIGAPNQPGGFLTNYVFSSWSDGGAQTHTIRAPASDTTYNAPFSRRLTW